MPVILAIKLLFSVQAQMNVRKEHTSVTRQHQHARTRLCHTLAIAMKDTSTSTAGKTVSKVRGLTTLFQKGALLIIPSCCGLNMLYWYYG